jgi:DNA topoisomerase-1
VLEAFWRDFKPKSDEVMEKKPSEVTEALDEFLSDYLFRPRKMVPIRANARPAMRAPVAARWQIWRLHRLLELSRMQVHPQIRPAGRQRDAGEEGEIGKHPATGQPIMRKAGRFGPYIQMGEGETRRWRPSPRTLAN